MALDKVGDVQNFSYTGKVQSISLNPGKYKIQLWGAQGGLSQWHAGAKGGYTEGILDISSVTTLYIAVGQQGRGITAHNTTSIVTFNGGGKVNAGYSNKYGEGGGATHCAFRNGVLSSLSNYKNQVCLVAGGGGGAGYNLGGVGGGLVGKDATNKTAYGGTQTSGGNSLSTNAASKGIFGQGGSDYLPDEGCGGGGGWYGGGAGRYNDSAAGGSSYIAYFIEQGNTIAGDASMPSISGAIETGHAGNGYAKITYIETPRPKISRKDRLNSNIYANIFPEEVLNVDYIEKLKENTIISCNEVRQENHGFQINDVVAYNSKDGYFKPLATKNTRDIIGVVSSVRNENIFTLMTEGRLEYPSSPFTDTTILYLSDKQAGKMVHYKDIENTSYIPIAIYTDRSIIINILDGVFGAPLAPYGNVQELPENFEHYDTSELQEVIDTIIGI